MFAWLFNDRLVLSTACLLVLLGSVSWFNIYNQEDPTFPYRSAQINFSYPGATAAEVEATVPVVVTACHHGHSHKTRRTSQTSIVAAHVLADTDGIRRPNGIAHP